MAHRQLTALALVVVLLIPLWGSPSVAAAQSDPCEGVSPPFVCPFDCTSPDPVCGANGVTYNCGCPEAACESVRVVRNGAC
ncbi:hypothetical protein LINPERPRIM_LOCUS27755 [Linum perenne]